MIQNFSIKCLYHFNNEIVHIVSIVIGTNFRETSLLVKFELYNSSIINIFHEKEESIKLS